MADKINYILQYENTCERIIAYCENKNFGKKGKLNLWDVLTDITPVDFEELKTKLLSQGYELILDCENINKKGVNIGDVFLSYFTFKKAELRLELEKLQKKIRLIKEELSKIKKTSKAGQKPLAEADTIKYIYSTYIEGESLSTIAKNLNKSEHKTKRGGRWHKSTIKAIIENNSYVDMNYITADQYENALLILKNKKKSKKIALSRDSVGGLDDEKNISKND